MPICNICLQDRRSLKFQTGRLRICRFCVNTLNSTELSARAAEFAWREAFKTHLHRTHLDAERWLDRWLEERGENILEKQIGDPECVRRSIPLKVLRAYRSGLICLDRRYLDYPANWEFKRFRLKHRHGYACCLCGAREVNGVVLHAHHIVFRSHSGTNSDRNLVTLCFQCHQEQHPDFNIEAWGGEGRGCDVDDMVTPDFDSEFEVHKKSRPIDPDLIAAGIYMAGYHIEHGARTFGAYANAMVDDLGGFVKPFLESWYEVVRNYPGMEAHAKEMTPVAMVSASVSAGIPELREAKETDPMSVKLTMLTDRYSKAWMKTEARQHWRRYLPRLFRRLSSSGELEMALDEAATRTRAAMDTLQMQANLKPDEAWPEVRSEWIILNPAIYNR